MMIHSRQNGGIIFYVLSADIEQYINTSLYSMMPRNSLSPTHQCSFYLCLQDKKNVITT